MVEYQPTSHRPIAQMFRRTGNGTTNLCVRLGIPPDAISYLSILAALAAAICFWKSGQTPWLLIVAPLFCYLRLWTALLSAAPMDPITIISDMLATKSPIRCRIHSVL